jgi:hypothetical protein
MQMFERAQSFGWIIQGNTGASSIKSGAFASGLCSDYICIFRQIFSFEETFKTKK